MDECSETILVRKEDPWNDEGWEDYTPPIPEIPYKKTERIINGYPVWKSTEDNNAVWFNGKFSQLGIFSDIIYRIWPV